MAPTELLAEQHAETWRGWAKRGGLRLELLTASTPRGVRASILALAAAGELDVADRDPRAARRRRSGSPRSGWW